MASQMIEAFLFAAAVFLFALAIILHFTWDTRPPPSNTIQGERRASVLNYYALTEGTPTVDDVACLRTCEASFDCSAVLPRGKGQNLSCELLTQSEVASTSLERLTAQPGFVQRNQVPPPARHVYFGRGIYSTTGRFWIDNRRHRAPQLARGRSGAQPSGDAHPVGSTSFAGYNATRVIRQEVLSYQPLPWRPKSIVTPEGAVGIYTPREFSELYSMEPAKWFTLEGVMPVYIHRPGEPLQVPVYWKTPWAIYSQADV